MTVINKNMTTCQNCGKEHDGSYGSGRFCSSRCAHGYGPTKILIQNKIHTYTCETCGKIFERKHPIRKGRKHTCNDCKNSSVHFKENPTSLTDFSKRTISKILFRSGKGCAICGWNKAICDVHHIKHRKNGGTDDNNNLVILCPNCHREIHSGVSDYTEDDLRKISVYYCWDELKQYYYPSN